MIFQILLKLNVKLKKINNKKQIKNLIFSIIMDLKSQKIFSDWDSIIIFLLKRIYNYILNKLFKCFKN